MEAHLLYTFLGVYQKTCDCLNRGLITGVTSRPISLYSISNIALVVLKRLGIITSQKCLTQCLSSQTSAIHL